MRLYKINVLTTFGRHAVYDKGGKQSYSPPDGATTITSDSERLQL